MSPWPRCQSQQCRPRADQPVQYQPDADQAGGGRLGTLRPTGKVTYFRVSTTDDLQGPAGADYFYKQAGAKKVYIIDDTETYGKGIADTFSAQFTKDGGTVLGRKGLDKTTQDFKPAVTEAVTLGADSIYYGGTDGDGGTKLRVQMVSVPGAANLIFGGGDGLQTDSFLKTTAQANALGAVVTVASVNADKLASAADFKTAFAKEYSDPAAYGAYSANAYDATNIMIQSIKKALDGGAVTPKDGSDSDGAKTFRQSVIDKIAKIDYNGVTGSHDFRRQRRHHQQGHLDLQVWRRQLGLRHPVQRRLGALTVVAVLFLHG